MIKIGRKELFEIIQAAEEEVSQHALPPNLDAKELQAYIFSIGIQKLLGKNGINIEIDKKQLFREFEEYGR